MGEKRASAQSRATETGVAQDPLNGPSVAH